jgi:DNA-directed RNA polymerase specialized sigma24 family protein
MSEVSESGLARRGTQSSRRQLAAMLRASGEDSDVTAALLTEYGDALFDFITLMVGPGSVAEQVLADTVIAATGLARRLRDEDMLTAWLFALARRECRRHPPVVWRAAEWDGLRSLARSDLVARRGSVPVDLVRMAVLGMGPRDREILVLSSTRSALLSDDLAAILRVSPEQAVEAVATAHEKFEQALARCAKEIGYQRDPRSRAPEIGELVGMVLTGIHRPLPFPWVVSVSVAPETAAYRDEVRSRAALDVLDGFPEYPESASRQSAAPQAEPARRPSSQPIARDWNRAVGFVPR